MTAIKERKRHRNDRIQNGFGVRRRIAGLRALVAMQLKDRSDMSYLSSFRTTLFKSVFSILGFGLVTGAFFGIMKICTIFKLFAFTNFIPDTVVTVVFSAIQILAVFSCTLNLTKSLYMAEDNRVLFTFPVEADTVFFSKLILYYFVELKRNITITLPLFIAYGLINGAVWYFYPWLAFCFFIISLLPVMIGTVLSIPSLLISKVVQKSKVLKFVLFVTILLGIAFVFFKVVGRIPENIDILGQWGSITEGIKTALEQFCQKISPLYSLCLMVVGGTVRISNGLFTSGMFITLGVTFALIIALAVMSYLLSRPLFFKMASSQFEHEKSSTAKGKNRVHGKRLSSLCESFTMAFRSSEQLIAIAVQLLLPTLTIFLLNKFYGAMNTSFTGKTMTRSFSLLVMLSTLLSSNSYCASILSREGAARNIIKTRPEQPISTVFSRIAPRLITGTVSAVAASFTYYYVSGISRLNMIFVLITAVFINAAHVLWSSEMDIMMPQSQQYITVGEDYSNPNEIKSTILAFVLSAIAAFLAYFLADMGADAGIIKTAAVCVILFAYRLYMYITRTNLYFVEK